jgi:uracil-DNA glycosylase
MQSRGQFVFGEGTPGGVLFVGAGPGRTEDQEGRPFVGESGRVLRDALDDCGLTDISYITHAVCCRSCAQAFDSEGHPQVNERGGPIIRDVAPVAPQLAACSSRLNEEIYLVDPVLVVALGGVAAAALLHRPVPFECGTLHTLLLPGAAHQAVKTEKRQVWLRKTQGTWTMPVTQHMVEYACMLCVHPADVLRSLGDTRPNSPADEFYKTLRVIRHLYDNMLTEVFRNET